VIIPCVAASLGFAWAGIAHSAVPLILALTVVNIGINAAKAPLWAMPSSFLSGASAAAGIAVINSLGNLGGFFGPFLTGWLKDRYGNYAGGLFSVAAMLAVSAIAMFLLSIETAEPAELTAPGT
jgi:ACS family tartrate transporter-like MFS transporter